MGEFFTGATVTKNEKLYTICYKNRIVAEFAIKELALTTAIDRVKLETLYQNSNIYFLKAA